jgi:hypothetical protein
MDHHLEVPFLHPSTYSFTSLPLTPSSKKMQTLRLLHIMVVY